MSESAAWFLLAWGVFPLLVFAGFMDWHCHRRTDIAHTSGLEENLQHWLMFAQVGAGCFAILFLEFTAGALVLLLAIFLVHELTVYWDLASSTLKRDVDPLEQMVHSFQELLPLFAIALVAVIAWPQALAILHAGDEPADWALRLKAQAPSPLFLVAGGAAVVLFNALPLLQETVACMRARTRPRPRSAARIDPRP